MIKFDVQNRFTGAEELSPPKRRGSPRSKNEVRARIAHTSTNGRRLDLFITQPVIELLGWRGEGGAISVCRVEARDNVGLILKPSHRGWRLHPIGRTTRTLRLAITTDALRPSRCAPVRAVSHEIHGDELSVSLPTEWFNPLRAWPEEGDPVAVKEAAE